jgi:hypothetical protein
MKRALLCLLAVLACLAAPPSTTARQDTARCDHGQHRSEVGGWPQESSRTPEPVAMEVTRARRGCTPVGPQAVQAVRDSGWSGQSPPLWGGQATVSPERRIHILDGDARGGGHRPGTGIPHKSEFPRGWSDNKIIEAIEDVANDPASARRVGADGRTVVTGQRQGVDLRVVIERDGRSIITGYPTNTPRDPR